ncbi:hypothetical protein ABG067_003948 [Albugo candida]|uniref:Uncharacterized protein n=1 Tax=Albugo candida TaxID=65357 RepID=A0A024G2X9_9STRA|nr:unnamed protein product [Albugo candida]|eukprot:CCI41130.1 unnamed protein product [Albugo candida]
MGGKAKFQKHTAKELQAKAAASKSKGGGKSGAVTRKTAKLNFICDVCKTPSPDATSLGLHYASKHPKVPFDREESIRIAEELRKANATQVIGTHHNGGRDK